MRGLQQLTTALLIPAVAFSLLAADEATVDNQRGPKNESSARLSKDRQQQILITPEREALAVEFAKNHHEELVALLSYLKKKLPKEHSKAIRHLYRTSERLAEIRARGDQQRYELELELWKSQSRAQLLAARVKMNDSSASSDELTNLVNKQFDLRLALLKRDQMRAQDRLNKLDEQIENLENSRDEFVERQLRVLNREPKSAPVSKNGNTSNQQAAPRD